MRITFDKTLFNDDLSRSLDHKWLIILFDSSLVVFSIIICALEYGQITYSSVFSSISLAKMDIWSRVFMACLVLTAFIFVGWPTLSLLKASILNIRLVPSPKTVKTPAHPVLDVTQTSKKQEKANIVHAVVPYHDDSTITVTESTKYKEALLQKLSTPYMKMSSGGGKTRLDRVLDDLEILRVSYRKNSKTKKDYSDKHILRYATILYDNETIMPSDSKGSFQSWVELLYNYLQLSPPVDIRKQNENNEIDEMLCYLD